MSFSNQLKSISFKTFQDKQFKIYGFDELFAHSRTLVVSIPVIFPSPTYLLQFDKNHQLLLDAGISKIICVSSNTSLIGPWAEKHSQLILGVYDFEQSFVSLLAQYYQTKKPIDHLVRFWQYNCIVNNGEPEQLWQNPVKVNTPWWIVKNPDFIYRSLGPIPVLEYLDSYQPHT